MYFATSTFILSTLAYGVLGIPQSLGSYDHAYCSIFYGHVEPAAIAPLEAQIRAWPQIHGVIIIPPGAPELKWVSGGTQAVVEAIDAKQGTMVNVDETVAAIEAINTQCVLKGEGGAVVVGIEGPITSAFVVGILQDGPNAKAHFADKAASLSH